MKVKRIDLLEQRSFKIFNRPNMGHNHGDINMSMRTLSGSPAYYPKLKEMEEGEVIFEKGKFVDRKESAKYGNMNYIFETTTPVITPDGKFTRIGVSGGQVANAMEKEYEEVGYGGWYKIVYTGLKTIKSGKWAGKDSHTFMISKYEDENAEVTESAATTTTGTQVKASTKTSAANASNTSASVSGKKVAGKTEKKSPQVEMSLGEEDIGSLLG